MEITKFEVEKILKTLPIGFYIKRNIDITLNEEGVSYYEPMNDKISIDYNTISKTLNDLDESYDLDLETCVRTLLYHEVSHAFLTPKTLEVSDIINIFEDERIESLLRTFYHNTNFKDFVKAANKFKGEPPKTPLEEFYQTVRYRIGKPVYLEDVSNIIIKYKNLTRETRFGWDLSDYTCAIKNLYENICKDWKNKENNNETSNENLSSNEKSNDDFKNTNSPEKGDMESLSSEEFINNVVNVFTNKKVIEDISSILNQFKKVSHNNSSSINAYSGIFNPRSVIRDDYKYFVQQNRLGHVKAYSKTHINLFIDSSGSFYCSEKLVNQILYALKKIEQQNSNFSFDLVTMSIGQKLHKKNDRILICGGGNNVTHEIYKQFKDLQFPECENINLVLFDGDAFSDIWMEKNANREKIYDNMKAFDTKNTTIISDFDNEKYIKNRCKQAKVIFTNRYVDNLYSNIIKSLKQLIK